MFENTKYDRGLNGKKCINLLIAGLAVLAGGLVYVCCRSWNPVWLIRSPLSGLSGLLTWLSHHSTIAGSHLPDWVIFSLPDGLWAFAYTSFIVTIWYKSKSRIRIIWYFTIPILTLGSEILQGMRILPGTFDPYDVALITFGLLLGIVLTNLTLKIPFHENANEIQYTG